METAESWIADHPEIAAANVESCEVKELEQARDKLREHTDELLEDWDKPLRFKQLTGTAFQIEQGILWVNGPFKEKFWPDRKPVKPGHACPDCGAKHAIKAGNGGVV